LTPDNNIEMPLTEAMEYAQKANDIWFDKKLLQAQENAQEQGLDISERIAEILISGYTTIADEFLKAAKHFAHEWNPSMYWVEEGHSNPDIMEVCLNRAQETSQIIDYDISGQVVDIERIAYTKGLPFKLDAAKRLANTTEKTEEIEHLLLGAEYFAQKLGQDISGQVAEIRTIVSNR